MPDLLKLIFGDPNKKVLAELAEVVEKINAFEPAVQSLSDEQLRGKTAEFKKRLAEGTTLDDILPEAFAVVRETARRQLKQRHFDVQLMGGIVLHRGGIAEMRTGEGKTLTSTLPIYLNAIEGKGVHLVTVNDYLAKRDAVWMGQIYNALGLTVGCIQHEGGYVYDAAYKHDPGSDQAETHDEERDKTGAFRVHTDYLRPTQTRAEAYAADITYGTNNEFGFDYLRDNMVMSFDQMAQPGRRSLGEGGRPLHYAIVDEIDSILIDEARTPLIISAPAEESDELYRKFAAIAKSLVENEDYNVDEKMQAVALTEAGIGKIEKTLGIENLYVAGGTGMVHHAEAALKAHALFKRDRDYVVSSKGGSASGGKDGEIVIVDEFTGRLMIGRRYSEGLHQAIEAKENVEVKRESETLATVTFQNYFRMYKKLSGMTGTAVTEAEEFSKIYNLDVTAIPTNRDNQRRDLPDRIYKSELGKFQAVVKEVKRLHELGQPVLVGTVSIEKNEILGEMMKREGIPFNLLNAKNHAAEAEVIAQAGSVGAVTIATNMAGRGVDIVLGGNPPNPEQAEKVKARGGLFVIGSERHEARRIDNQLRGRSGRQGDPGVTQFYVSMEDDLMRIFGSDRVRGMMDRLGIPEDVPIENRMVSGSIEKAQHRVEGHHFDIRKHLLEYDDVLNKHRELIYGRRREILEAYAKPEKDNLQSLVLEILEGEVEQVVMFHTGESAPGAAGGPGTGDWNVKEIMEVAATFVPLSDEKKAALAALTLGAAKDKMNVAEKRTQIIGVIMDAAREAYGTLEKRFEDRQKLKDAERNVLIRSIDRLWIDHLDAMTSLRTGIGLRGYAQQDPLIAYKKEAYGMFNALLAAVNQEVAANFFKYAFQVSQPHRTIQLPRSLLERAGVMLAGAAKTSEKGSDRTAAGKPIEKAGRNDPCPCGSGKKYKKCHGA